MVAGPGVRDVDVAKGRSNGKPATVGAGFHGTGPAGLGKSDSQHLARRRAFESVRRGNVGGIGGAERPSPQARAPPQPQPRAPAQTQLPSLRVRRNRCTCAAETGFGSGIPVPASSPGLCGQRVRRALRRNARHGGCDFLHVQGFDAAVVRDVGDPACAERARQPRPHARGGLDDAGRTVLVAEPVHRAVDLHGAGGTRVVRDHCAEVPRRSSAGWAGVPARLSPMRCRA